MTRLESKGQPNRRVVRCLVTTPIRTCCVVALTMIAILIVGCRVHKAGSPNSGVATGYPIPATSAYPVKVDGIFRVNFPNGATAFVMNYETNIRIEDMPQLEAEVDKVWAIFQREAEDAGVTSAVIRAAHYEGLGALRQGNGYGFVFERDREGRWRRVLKQ